MPIELLPKLALVTALFLTPQPEHHHKHHHPKPEPPTTQEAPGSTPAPSPPPSYQPAFGSLTEAQVANYARQAGFPESVIPTMVAIAYRESHWIPTAINTSSGACGLWQIYPAQPGCTNPATNAAYAYAKYRASGLAPWGM